ncbi:MAG: bifunctional DNA-formamidopyrimidine glycosylase/DNA-(apurinic or apyrimidinic site) lyase [Gammaproteobacteria bacterium]|nr:bifunctional DNA-formamidopyrimidine glycosylase/DNA-(apurinic or apyrimidinic site) lyase [Gammaproteobacteria bacterium]
MPELPEVETTRRGLEPRLIGHRVRTLRLRDGRLRQPVPDTLARQLAGASIQALSRRGKYLLVGTDRGSALIHLGMSGSLRMVNAALAPAPHEHYDWVLDNGQAMRYRDPRRFGMLLWAGREPETHPLLRGLGPEPLGDTFDGDYLYRASRGRRVPVKNFLMNSHVVVGVGNIYASEALFHACIHPHRPAGHIGGARYSLLAEAVKSVFVEAIAIGGTTLRDFVNAAGDPGYFAIRLAVYGREGEPCPRCGIPIRRSVIGQRSSYYCPRCQR